MSACRYITAEGVKPRGRGKKTWLEGIAGDLKSSGLKGEQAQDRVLWKSCTSGRCLTRASIEQMT